MALRENEPLLQEVAQESSVVWARRFLEMMENVSLISVVLDCKCNILFANRFLCDLTGWTKEEITGRNWLELFIPIPNRPEMKRVFSACIGGETQVIHYENPIMTRSGELRLIQWSNTWLRDSNGVVEGTASIGEDKTEQKRAAELELAYEKRLLSLAMSLAGTEDRERMRLATSLHEGIAQSLASAKLSADMLTREPLTPTGESTLQRLRDAIQDSVSQVRRLMADLSPPAFAFQDLFSSLSFVADAAMREYQVNVRVKGGRQRDLVADEHKQLLVSSLRELLLNAVKHGKAQTVEVALKRKGACLEMTVRDDGVGFDVSQLGQNYDFTDGFGLFNLRERLLFSGGEFSIKSAIGSGTAVSVRVPISKG